MVKQKIKTGMQDREFYFEYMDVSFMLVNLVDGFACEVVQNTK